jgi:hypothetical protein
MFGRKFAADIDDRKGAPGVRGGVANDPIEENLAAILVVLVAILLFTMSHDTIAEMWADINSCLGQVLRTAGI